MKLVENWRDAPRWYSMWAASAVITIGGISAYLTPEMLAAPVLFFEGWTYQRVLASMTAFFGVTGMIGRLVSQPPKVTTEAEQSA